MMRVYQLSQVEIAWLRTIRAGLRNILRQETRISDATRDEIERYQKMLGDIVIED